MAAGPRLKDHHDVSTTNNLFELAAAAEDLLIPIRPRKQLSFSHNRKVKDAQV
jgi:hypothetical protein